MKRPYHPVDKAVRRLFYRFPQALLKSARIPLPAHPILVKESIILTSDFRADFVCILPDTHGNATSVLMAEFQLIPKKSELPIWFTKKFLLRHQYKLPTTVLVLYLTRGPYRTFPDQFVEQAGATNTHILQKVHLWEEKERILKGELWELLPLLVLCEESPTEATMEETIERIMALSHSTEEKMFLLDIAYEVSLRYFPRSRMNVLFKKEAEVAKYRTIIDEWRDEALTEGRAAGARSLILRLGTKRFGPPSEEVEAYLLTITSTKALDALADRLMEVESWQELLPRRRQKKQEIP